MTPALLTHRLLLRPLEHEDVAVMATLYQHIERATGLSAKPLNFWLLHASAMILMIRAAEQGGMDYGWAIENEAGEVIGQITLRHKQPDAAELRFLMLPKIWESEIWRSGIWDQQNGGTDLVVEALGGVLEWAQRFLGISTFVAKLHMPHGPSGDSLTHLGFTQKGLTTSYVIERPRIGTHITAA
ncbi:GNAT family N-acetyltransferase [Candidatus Phycosocius spiralis]|uniref:N-acetyltransferase domain-containing protein n=1 Tax=Candidatus Phycosocius spiralis TaxID=2815099 RepID=A0ABQ4PUT2_9PROT|nr:GNAT family N-acetyltransferase [Candidatus Phycosocius spiralis]GIU66776.1 hypothetical protein PsB1_0930 [Candidatus Phycosocius spiralis]